jgi:hypothetical protein
MNHKAFVASLSLAALVLGTAAHAQPGPQSKAAAPCLRMDQIDSFMPIKGNDKAVIVVDKFRRRYKLTFTGICGGLDYNMGVGIHSRGVGGLSCVSRGDEVISKDPGSFNGRCPVDRVELYTPVMESADRAAAAAKGR